MRISDWSSDVCSSDLNLIRLLFGLSYEVAVVPPAVKATMTLTGLVGQSAARTLWLAQAPSANGPMASVDRIDFLRSEERRVGKECISTCRSWWSPYIYKKKNIKVNENVNTQEI